MVIASRTLKLRTSGEVVDVPVRLFKPEQQGADWSCRFEIAWPDQPRSMEICGVDSVQAMDLAMRTIGAVIYTSEHHKSGRLYAWEPGQGYGFPVSRNLRDLLVGDDAKYF
jgi:hypothetical protein